MLSGVCNYISQHLFCAHSVAVMVIQQCSAGDELLEKGGQCGETSQNPYAIEPQRTGILCLKILE